jgi:hypothetical protein
VGIMNSKDCETEIEKYGWKELLGLWEEIQNFNTINWNSGKALEYLDLFSHKLYYFGLVMKLIIV